MVPPARTRDLLPPGASVCGEGSNGGDGTVSSTAEGRSNWESDCFARSGVEQPGGGLFSHGGFLQLQQQIILIYPLVSERRIGSQKGSEMN